MFKLITKSKIDMKKMRLLPSAVLAANLTVSSSGKTIKSFVAVGDVIEVLHYGEKEIYKIEQFEVIMNSLYAPTEFVIHVKFSYNNGVSSIECTSDNFKYVRHISHCC